MGFLDSIESLAGQQAPGQPDHAGIAGALMQALEEHPGGIQSVVDNFKQNGMGDHVDALASGEQQTTSPEQVQQGLAGTGLVEKVAARAGVSPQMAQMAIAALMPMVLSHFSRTGEAPRQSQFGGMAQQLLSRFL